VAFWKNELDHAVDEKNALLERYTALYRHAFDLEQYAGQLGSEASELRHVLDATLQDERRVAAAGAGGGGSGAIGRLSTAGSGSPVPSGGSTPDGRAQLMAHLASCRTALKQADVRIAILQERCLALTQVCGCELGWGVPTGATSGGAFESRLCRGH
jgi:hypothetical protein